MTTMHELVDRPCPDYGPGHNLHWLGCRVARHRPDWAIVDWVYPFCGGARVIIQEKKFVLWNHDPERLRLAIEKRAKEMAGQEPDVTTSQESSETALYCHGQAWDKDGFGMYSMSVGMLTIKGSPRSETFNMSSRIPRCLAGRKLPYRDVE